MDIKAQIYKTFDWAFGIEQSEFNLVQLFFIYIMIISTGYTITSTAAITLFLSKTSQNTLHELLPWLYISNAIAIALIAKWYESFIDKVSRLKLITYTTWFFIFSFLIIRLLINIFGKQASLYFFLMVWDETCAVILIMVFFSYLGDYFFVESAKKVFGYIAGGMALGAPAGGFGSVILLRYLQPANLLFVSICFLALSNLIALIIWKTAIAPKRSATIVEHHKPLPLKRLLNHPYLQAIFITVIAGSICTAIEVYQLFYVASETLNEAALGSFMGKLFGYIGVAQLFIDFVLARFLFKYVGVLNILLFLPLLFILLSFGFVLYPILMFAAGIKFIDAGVTGTLGNISTQILLLPLPERIRMHSQSILTGIMGTSARVIGGIVLVIFSLFLLPIRYYSVVILIAAIVWLWQVLKIIKLYKNKSYENW